jgi:hypothetical protein
MCTADSHRAWHVWQTPTLPQKLLLLLLLLLPPLLLLLLLLQVAASNGSLDVVLKLVAGGAVWRGGRGGGVGPSDADVVKLLVRKGNYKVSFVFRGGECKGKLQGVFWGGSCGGDVCFGVGCGAEAGDWMCCVEGRWKWRCGAFRC